MNSITITVDLGTLRRGRAHMLKTLDDAGAQYAFSQLGEVGVLTCPLRDIAKVAEAFVSIMDDA